MNYILTPGGIHLILNSMPVALAKSDPHFAAVIDAIQKKATDQQIEDILEAEKRKMEKAVSVVPGIELKGGQLYFLDEPIAGILGQRMLQMLEEGFDLTPMAAFLTNLENNPSRRVVEHLYAFIDYGKNPITDDGHFLTYKAIRSDWKDIHSGNFDNSIGQVLSMRRNKVDENQNNTCSHGFHVCSFDYLPHFANAAGHVVVCKVNPADVVAIPADYSNTKMRVCKYEVISEYAGYYEQKGDILSGAAVSETGAGGTFSLEVMRGEFSAPVSDESFDRLSDAAVRMEELLEDDSVYSVSILNTVTGAVVAEGQNLDFDEEGSTSSSFGESEDYFSIVGMKAGNADTLANDYESMSEAVSAALDYDGYDAILIQDRNGNTVKTIS